jgi:hypothetical protein
LFKASVALPIPPPSTAAALGGLGGAVDGGGIGKATDALNKKLGIEATPGQ